MDTLRTDRTSQDSGAPLYQQVYNQLQDAILFGELKHGARLPSTRAMADQLGVSRNTVLNAYRQLLAEGYLESVEGSGTYVARVLPDHLLTAQNLPRIQEDEPAGTPLSLLSERARLQLGSPLQPESGRHSFNEEPHPFRTDLPALDAFPYKLWSRLIMRRARHTPSQDFRYQDSAGYLPLRQAIAAQINVSRQVHCTPEQIIITSGAQGALDLAVRMLVDPGDAVWLEEPGYPGARGAFLGAGAHIVPVPVDADGLVVTAGVQHAEKAKLAYLTPSHQFPLGVTLSLARRFELLEWARQAGAYILEDDYDSEYRFAGRPLASLQGIDEAGRVIYIGTFSKVLFPALRIGYLVLPQPLVDPFLKVRRLTGIHSPLLEQAVLADFIVEGYYSRHLRRMRNLYTERRQALLEAARELPLGIQSQEAGIHCIGWLPAGIDDEELVRRASRQDLDLTPISTFAMQPMQRKGLLLGFGGFDVTEIQAGVRRLAHVLDSFKRLRRSSGKN